MTNKHEAHEPGTARLPLSPLSLLFYTKTCLSVRLARFLVRFFRAKRVDPARLGPMRDKLGQEIKPVGLDNPIF